MSDSEDIADQLERFSHWMHPRMLNSAVEEIRRLRQELAAAQTDIKRLRQAVERMGNTADEISLLKEITDKNVRIEIRSIGSYACEVLTAAAAGGDK